MSGRCVDVIQQYIKTNQLLIQEIYAFRGFLGLRTDSHMYYGYVSICISSKFRQQAFDISGN